MTDLWIVLVEDRHTDVEALPFSSEAAALAEAERQAADNALDPGDVSEGELTPDMIQEGWVLLLEYGTERDCVRVVKREMDRSAYP